jgi:RimJ/RimL family protein N-acetyltransferase
MDRQMKRMELMATQVATLFVLDGNGRLTAVNSDDGIPTPRFFFGSTMEGNLWRFRFDLPSEIRDELESLCLREPVRSDLKTPPENLDAFKKILNSQQPIKRSWFGPAYWIPEGDPKSGANAVQITEENSHVLKEGFPDNPRWINSCQPVYAVIREGKAVSVCLSARVAAEAYEAGVETLEDHRGNGYASCVVAAWAEEVRRLGRIPFYSTSWDNVASQGVARKLGAQLFGADLHFT